MDKMNREIDLHHRRTQAVLRLFGPIVLGVGVISTAIGLLSFYSSFGTFEPPRYFLAAIIGLPLIGIGLGITRLGYLGAYFRYFCGEVTPVAKDTFNTMSEGARHGLETMAHAAGRGFSTGLGTLPPDEQTVACAHCEVPNPADARFCSQCGTALKGSTCADCGAALVDRIAVLQPVREVDRLTHLSGRSIVAPGPPERRKPQGRGRFFMSRAYPNYAVIDPNGKFIADGAFNRAGHR